MLGHQLRDQAVQTLGLTVLLLLLQGKFINDPKVLLEAAQGAGLADAEKVVADPEAGRQQVRLWTAAALGSITL